ncbi:hypothetical protein [Defluviimonas sp. SAOS-178_SWC]|uniref:hypothetical protein n=1 Tax=Defluviimonas sp. SAOS-178_SWC TaxID=3121287 RepID=UPI003221C085
MSLFDTTANYPAGPARTPLGSALLASIATGFSHFRRDLETEAEASHDRSNKADRDYLKDIGVEIGF